MFSNGPKGEITSMRFIHSTFNQELPLNTTVVLGFKWFKNIHLNYVFFKFIYCAIIIHLQTVNY